MQPQRLGCGRGLDPKQTGPLRSQGYGLCQCFTRSGEVSAFLQRTPQAAQGVGLLVVALGMRYTGTVAGQRLIATACQTIPVAISQGQRTADSAAVVSQRFVQHCARSLRVVLRQ